MTIDLGFQIIGVVLAANAVFFALILFMLERDRSRLKNNVKDLDMYIKRTDSMVEALVNWMIMSDKLSKLDEALLINLANNDVVEGYIQKTSIRRNEVKKDLSKHREELMLHCANEEWRNSAYRTLANGLGDFETFEIMERLARVDPASEKTNNYFRIILKKRLILMTSKA